MKWLSLPAIIVASVAILAPPATAQVPSVIGYNGFLSDDDGPVSDTVNIQVSLFTEPAPESDESALWTEFHRDISVVNGAFTLSLGTVTSIEREWFEINDRLYLEFIVDGDVLAPRARLDSVPFAIRAGIADEAISLMGFDPADVMPAIDAECPEDEVLAALFADGTYLCAPAGSVSADDIRGILDDEGVARTGDPVSWTTLTDVPAGFADGTDDGGPTITESEVDDFVSNNGFITLLDLDWDNILNMPSDFADGVDDDTQLDEATVDAFVDNNGFLRLIDLDWDSLLNVPAGFADGVDDDTQLDEAAVDAFVDNNGYLEADDLHWDNVAGIPSGFADNVDDDTQLDEATVDAMTDNNGYLEADDLQWSGLSGVPAGFADNVDHAYPGTACSSGQQPVWNTGSSTWSCQTIPIPDPTIRTYTDGGGETTETYTHDRYHLTTTASASGGRTRQIPNDILHELCGDFDGCEVRIAMVRWDGVGSETAQASRGPFIFHYNQADRRWRLSTDASGIDANGSTQHIYNAWDTCYFTDGEYSGWTSLNDSVTGVNLLTWNGYGGSQRRCELTLID